MKYKIAISEPSEAIDPLVTNLSAYIAKSKRALIVTGAGISCSSGIPVSENEILHHLFFLLNALTYKHKGLSIGRWSLQLSKEKTPRYSFTWTGAL